MIKKLRWRKGFLKSAYRIYSSDKVVGSLKENHWKMTAVAELSGKKYFYKTTGFFNQKTNISETFDGPKVGMITYNSFRTTAQIENKHGVFNWKNENWNHSRWNLFGPPGIQIKYRGSSTKGEMESNAEDAFLMLTGLFIANYFWQRN